MLDLVTFLMKHFHDACTVPDEPDLAVLLEDAGFGDDAIDTVLMFVALLRQHAAEPPPRLPDLASPRVYLPDETAALPADVRGLLHFFVADGNLNAAQREWVVHALMHLSEEDITVENTKILSALVLWAQHCELPGELALMLRGDHMMH